MKQIALRVCVPLALFAALMACKTNNPASPTSNGTSSVTSPNASTPANNSQIANAAQPITLTVANGVTTGDTPTYTFEVATDSGFANIVSTKSGVQQGANGKTSATMDTLSPSKQYYWRTRLTSGGSTGPNSKTQTFTIGAAVTLSTPQPASPAQNGTGTTPVILSTNNVQTTGPAGAISYRFDVADSSSFGHIIFTTTVPQQAGSQTSVTVTIQLTQGSSYYWRVQAADPANFITTPFSATFAFTAQNFNMAQATMQSTPADFASWPQTANVTSIVFTPDAMMVDFDKRMSADHWPEEPFGSGSIQYTLGMCLNISGHWYCSTVVQFWFGRDLAAGGVPSEVGINWFYDPARWGPMTGHQPQTGETIGMFVGSGNLRGRTDPSYVTCPTVCERSNVVLFPFPDTNSTTTILSAGQIKLQTGKR